MHNSVENTTMEDSCFLTKVGIKKEIRGKVYVENHDFFFFIYTPINYAKKSFWYRPSVVVL